MSTNIISGGDPNQAGNLASSTPPVSISDNVALFSTSSPPLLRSLPHVPPPDRVVVPVADPQKPVFTVFTLDSTMAVADVIGEFDLLRTRSTVERLASIPAAADQSSTYDGDVADLLSFASAWAYTEPPDFAFMMTRRGFTADTLKDEHRHDGPPEDWNYVAMRINNDPLFVVATAYLIQSPDRSVAILCFRGTEPTNVLNWLTDLSVSPERFIEGLVHGGIFRNLQALWPLVDKGLELVDFGIRITPQSVNNPPGSTSCGTIDKHKLKSLYITGHSLGGAMAALAAANIWKNAKYASLRSKLRGVYTYGAPMVAAPDLADTLDREMGHLVFRHVYAKDIVPRLPPLTTGRYKHFGREFRSDGPAQGWMHHPEAVSQTTSVLSLMIGGFALVAEQFPVLRRYLNLPYSVDHHSPRYYISISELSLTSQL